MKFFRQFAIVATLLLQLPRAFADDVITNFMSPIASFQYQEDLTNQVLANGGIQSPVASFQYLQDFSSTVLTNGGVVSPIVSYDFVENISGTVGENGGIISPIVSYQYYEWPSNGILNLQYSPPVSYYYQFINAPVLTIIPTNRTPTTAETTPAWILNPPPSSQLMAYHGGIFTTNLNSVDRNEMTVVLTHGWIPLNPLTSMPLFTPNGIADWPITMAMQLRSAGVTANIVAWNWEGVAQSWVTDPKQVGGQTPGEGVKLGSALSNTLGATYSKPIHFIGHSFGTLVNAYAANFLQGTNFAGEPVSTTPWPATNMQMTLFDEAEVGADKNFILNAQDLAALVDATANLLTASAFYRPLPRQFAWADNYVSAFGLLQPGAANVILTNGFPANAPDPDSWFIELGAFHDCPMPWYSETVQDDGASVMGFRWSFEEGGWFSQAPSAGSVYLQNGSGWDLTPITWNTGTNLLVPRFQAYRGGFGSTVVQFAENTINANGTVLGQAIGDANAVEWLINLYTGPGNSPASQFGAQPLGSPGNGNATNIPAFAWVQLVIPSNAVSMSFDYMVGGDWRDDSLVAALNGTNVLLLAGSEIQTDIVFGSGPIDVSAYTGQTNEFFLGIVGGTSTNAQLTVENLTFAVLMAPMLQAQANDGNLVLSWPVAARNFILQTTTDLVDPNSWAALTNTPAIVNLQNSVSSPISADNQFYRLVMY